MTLYRGTITRVTDDGIFTQVTALGAGYEWGPMPFPNTPDSWATGQDILVSNVGAVREDLVVLAAVSSDPATLAMDDLSDVVLTTPVDGQMLAFDGTNWVNISHTLDTLTDVTITTPALDHVLQYNGTQWVNQKAISLRSATSTDGMLTTRVTGDSVERFKVDAAGAHSWGAGSGAADTTLYRGAADQLWTDDSLFLTDNAKQINIGASASSGKFTAKLPLTTTILTSSRVTTDLANRYQVAADGLISWGSGALAVDATFGRVSSTVLGAIGSQILSSRATSLLTSFSTQVTGDTGNRFWIDAGGTLHWGAGNGAGDVSLFRSGTAQLKTDFDFVYATRSLARGHIGANTRIAGTAVISSSSGTETAIASAHWAVEPVYSFEASRLYRVSLTGASHASSVPAASRFMVRKGQQTTSGTELLRWEHFYSVAGVGADCHHVGYIKNTTGSTVLTALSLTITQLSGGTVDLGGDSTRPLILAVEDLGNVNDHVALAGIAKSV